MRSRSLLPVLCAALAVGFLLPGCAAPEPRPALVARSAGETYGYTDIKLSETRYDIVYESPRLDVPLNRESREARLEDERQRAYDFALWHAAEMARDLGYPALTVEHDRRDADVDVQRERYYDTWPGFYHPYYGRYYGHPYYYGRPYGAWPGGYRGWATARITASLRVQFRAAAGEGALSVDELLADLSTRYGTPTYP